MAHIKEYYTKIEQMRVSKGLESHTVPLCRTIGRDGDTKWLHRRSGDSRVAIASCMHYKLTAFGLQFACNGGRRNLH